jgi:hypothetical protein
MKASPELQAMLNKAKQVSRVLHTMEFPTEVIEEGFVRAQIESVNDQTFARIVWPEREIEEHDLIRLELKAISLWNTRNLQ